jgi:uncharacterized protein (UPF0332 family)
MKKQKFLKHLKKTGKIKITTPSNEISNSYLEKSKNCLKSSKILFQNNLYENSLSESYYSMYNSLLSLLFKIGIKSENHSGSIFIFEELFQKPKLSNLILEIKKERIDKQYYTEMLQKTKVDKMKTESIISSSEDFSLEIRQILNELSLNDIHEKLKTLKNLLE